MSNQHNPLQAMNFNQEFQFINNTLCLQVCLRMVGKTSGPARQCNAVIAWKMQAILEEVVKLLADAAIGTVNGCSMDAGLVVGQRTAVRQCIVMRLHSHETIPTIAAFCTLTVPYRGKRAAKRLAKPQIRPRH